MQNAEGKFLFGLRDLEARQIFSLDERKHVHGRTMLCGPLIANNRISVLPIMLEGCSMGNRLPDSFLRFS